MRRRTAGIGQDDRLTMRRVDIRQSPFLDPSGNVIRCGQVEGGDHVLHCCRPLAIVGIVHAFAGLRRSRLDRFAERPYPFCPREQPRPVQMDDQGEGFRLPGLIKNRPLLQMVQTVAEGEFLVRQYAS